MSLDQIISIILALMAALPMPLIVQKVLSMEKSIASVVPAAESDKIKSIVRSAVSAVEQTCSAMQGPDKKSEAVRLIGTLLNEHGMKVSPTMLDTLIEQAVLLINQGQDPQMTQQVPVVKP